MYLTGKGPETVGRKAYKVYYLLKTVRFLKDFLEKTWLRARPRLAVRKVVKTLARLNGPRLPPPPNPVFRTFPKTPRPQLVEAKASIIPARPKGLPRPASPRPLASATAYFKLFLPAPPYPALEKHKKAAHQPNLPPSRPPPACPIPPSLFPIPSRKIPSHPPSRPAQQTGLPDPGPSHFPNHRPPDHPKSPPQQPLPPFDPTLMPLPPLFSNKNIGKCICPYSIIIIYSKTIYIFIYTILKWLCRIRIYMPILETFKNAVFLIISWKNGQHHK